MTAPGWIALNRFGLGSTPADIPPAYPQKSLIEQLARFEPGPPALAQAGSSVAMVAALAQYREQVKAAKASGDAAVIAMKANRGFLREGYIAQASARMIAALNTPAPFAERLTHFWANHFAVSTDKQATIGLAGTMEFEAIRPNLTGSFTDLWLAVMRHPAMLLYLDQAQSIGPNAPVARIAAARGRKLGLNENLAREAMELHSLGVRSGYTQADVTELARALTGWTVGGFAQRLPQRLIGYERDEPGRFLFRAAMHEPGERTVLGRRYPDRGEMQARAILGDLAARPETATHIATKIARHFVADDPAPAMVTRIAAAFQSSGGDLPTVYRALVHSPEAWTPMATKFKSPWDWTISVLRGVGGTTADQKAVGAVAELGQPIWKPGSPAGWADTAGTWAGPDALLRRVEVAQRIAQLVPETVDARVLGPRLLGPLSAPTARVIAAADSPRQALALLFASPEFQRR